MSGESKHKLETGLYYTCESVKGDCGTPLVVVAGAHTGCILGIHVAGTVPGLNRSTSHGMATIVDLATVHSGTTDSVSAESGEEEEELHTQGFDIGGNITHVRILPPEETVYVNRQSKIRRSLLHGKLGRWQPLKEPAVLSRHDPRNLSQRDPIEVSLEVLKNARQVDLSPDDIALIKGCEQESYAQLKKGLQWPVGKRTLNWKVS